MRTGSKGDTYSAGCERDRFDFFLRDRLKFPRVIRVRRRNTIFDATCYEKRIEKGDNNGNDRIRIAEVGYRDASATQRLSEVRVSLSMR